MGDIDSELQEFGIDLTNLSPEDKQSIYNSEKKSQSDAFAALNNTVDGQAVDPSKLTLKEARELLDLSSALAPQPGIPSLKMDIPGTNPIVGPKEEDLPLLPVKDLMRLSLYPTYDSFLNSLERSGYKITKVGDLGQIVAEKGGKRYNVNAGLADIIGEAPGFVFEAAVGTVLPEAILGKVGRFAYTPLKAATKAGTAARLVERTGHLLGQGASLAGKTLARSAVGGAASATQEAAKLAGLKALDPEAQISPDELQEKITAAGIGGAVAPLVTEAGSLVGAGTRAFGRNLTGLQKGTMSAAFNNPDVAERALESDLGDSAMEFGSRLRERLSGMVERAKAAHTKFLNDSGMQVDPTFILEDLKEARDKAAAEGVKKSGFLKQEIKYLKKKIKDGDFINMATLFQRRQDVEGAAFSGASDSDKKAAKLIRKIYRNAEESVGPVPETELFRAVHNVQEKYPVLRPFLDPDRTFDNTVASNAFNNPKKAAEIAKGIAELERALTKNPRFVQHYAGDTMSDEAADLALQARIAADVRNKKGAPRLARGALAVTAATLPAIFEGPSAGTLGAGGVLGGGLYSAFQPDIAVKGASVAGKYIGPFVGAASKVPPGTVQAIINRIIESGSLPKSQDKTKRYLP